MRNSITWTPASTPPVPDNSASEIVPVIATVELPDDPFKPGHPYRDEFRFIFAWYDFWVGLFWDAKKRRLYVFPVPMLGFYVQLARRHRFDFTERECEDSDWRIVASNLKAAQRYMEQGCPAGRYTWLDAPNSIAESRAKQEAEA